MKIEAVVAVASAPFGPGALGAAAAGRDLEILVSELQAPYYKQTKFGRTYLATVGVAGVAPGTAIGTVAALSIFNPALSGVDGVLTDAWLAYVSGTFAEGTLYYCMLASATAPTGGTSITPNSGYLGAGAGKLAAMSNATIPTGSLPIVPMASWGAFAPSTPLAPSVVRDELRGGIIIPPGTIFSLQAVGGAGTTPLIVPGVRWMEVPI